MQQMGIHHVRNPTKPHDEVPGWYFFTQTLIDFMQGETSSHKNRHDNNFKIPKNDLNNLKMHEKLNAKGGYRLLIRCP